MDRHPLKHIIEAALLTAGKPLSMQHLQQLLADDDEEQTPLAKEFVQAGLDALAHDFEDRGIELKLVASGYRLQVRQSLEPWIAKLFEERPPRYSRALLETLALVGYRQPITRAEIEDVRGVSVSSNIIRTLLEREWIKVVGHRDVPGRPSMYGTTKEFLDYFNLTSLSELPELGQLMDLDKATAEFDKANGDGDGDKAANDGEEGEEGESEEGQDAEGESAEATAEHEGEVESESADESVASAEDDSEQPVESDASDSDVDAEVVDAEAESQESENAASTDSDAEAEVTAESEGESSEVETAEAAAEEEDLADGESQEDIDADVESLIRMLDAEAGSGSGSAEAPVTDATEPQTEAATESSHSENQSTKHEAASGESITPADLLRRHSTDFEH